MTAGFPKIKVSGKGSFTPPDPIQLAKNLPLGTFVYWDDLGPSGDIRQTGILKRYDANYAILDVDGSEAAVELP